MAVPDFAQGVTDSNYWAAHLSSMKPQVKTAAAASTGPPLITTSADGKSFFENVLDIVNPLEHLPVVSTIYSAITGNKSGDVEKIAGDTLYGGVIGLASSLANVAFEKVTGKDFGDTMLAMVGIGGEDDGKNTALASNIAKKTDAEIGITAALNKASLTPATKIAQAATAMPLMNTVSPVAPIATATPAQLTASSNTKVAAAQTTEAQPATISSANTSAQNAVDISPQTDALLEALQKNGVTGAMQSQALDAYRRTMTLNTQQTATVH